MTNEEIDALLKKHCGCFHGPNVEHASIEQQAFYALVREAIAKAKKEERERINKGKTWVAMDERLPPVNTPIMVFAKGGVVTCASLDHDPSSGWVFWDGVGFGGYEWKWEWDGSGDWRGVTHWMPLPPQPISEVGSQRADANPSK